jgi:hypothetical protein
MENIDKDMLGKFQAIESFLISPDNQYGIIGDVIEGVVRPEAYAHIRLNGTLNLTAIIDEVKEIQLSSEQRKHMLILFNEPGDGVNGLLFAMNVGCEVIEIRISGED